MLNALRTLIKTKAPWNDAQKIQVLAWLDAAEDFGENLDKCAEKLEEAKAIIKIAREAYIKSGIYTLNSEPVYKEEVARLYALFFDRAEDFLKECENA